MSKLVPASFCVSAVYLLNPEGEDDLIQNADASEEVIVETEEQRTNDIAETTFPPTNQD